MSLFTLQLSQFSSVQGCIKLLPVFSPNRLGTTGAVVKWKQLKVSGLRYHCAGLSHPTHSALLSLQSRQLVSVQLSTRFVAVLRPNRLAIVGELVGCWHWKVAILRYHSLIVSHTAHLVLSNIQSRQLLSVQSSTAFDTMFRPNRLAIAGELVGC